jgi:hypothetical protein
MNKELVACSRTCHNNESQTVSSLAHGMIAARGGERRGFAAKRRKKGHSMSKTKRLVKSKGN